jgi:hypothetical protein
MTQPPEPHLRRPIAGLDPAEDRLLAMIAALASEVAMLRERLDTVERLAEAGGALSRPDIESFAPSPEATAERDALRQRSIEKIFRPLRDASRTLATPPAKD